MIPENVTIKRATKDDVLYIWNHIRKHDYEELTRQGITNDNVLSLVDSPELYCGKVNNIPTCIFGAGISPHVIYLWFFGTDAVNKYMKTLTIFGRAYAKQIIDENFGKRLLISVWDQHKQSIRFIKLLGFTKTAFEYGPAEARFNIYERY